MTSLLFSLQIGAIKMSSSVRPNVAVELSRRHDRQTDDEQLNKSQPGGAVAYCLTVSVDREPERANNRRLERKE